MRSLFIPIIIFGMVTIPPHNQTEQIIKLDSPDIVLGDDSKGSLLHLPCDYAVGNGDTIYVLDCGDNRVVVFDLQGTELFTFGGEGYGPGEFISSPAILFYNNCVYVLDSRLMRVTEFSCEGNLQRTIRLQFPPSHFTGYQNNLLITSISSTAILWRVPLVRPEEQECILSSDDSVMSELQGITSGDKMVCIADSTLFVSVGRLSRILKLTFNAQGAISAMRVLEPQSTQIEAYWEYFNTVIAPRNSPSRSIAPMPFGMISLWDEHSLLLSVNVRSQEGSNVVTIKIDNVTAEDSGLRLLSDEGPIFRITRHNDCLIGIDLSSATVNIYEGILIR